MSKTLHPVITKDSPENLVGGIMVCGINFGFSSEDERLESEGVAISLPAQSFISDSSLQQSRFLSQLLKWMRGWGVDLEGHAGREGAFERSFFQTNWIDSQTRSVLSDEPIRIEALVLQADGVLGLIEARKPKLILLVGRDLIEALNDIRLRPRVERLLGPRPGNAIVHQGDATADHQVRFKVFTQSFPNAEVICLPHPQARGLTDEYMKTFASLIGPIFDRHRCCR